jgi:SAM-dependent methyltransferase
VLIADLRRPVADPDLGPHWSRLSTIQSICGETASAVLAALTGEDLRIADVGCGNGYLALELARAGHEVFAFDPMPERIEVARRAAEGRLEFATMAAGDWNPAPESLQAVVFNQSLHHIPDLEGVLAAVERALAPGGTIIATEHGYDRLDDAGAGWLHQNQQLLHAAGVARAPEQTAGEIVEKWIREGREEGLHPAEVLGAELRRKFEVISDEVLPFLYMFIAEELDAGNVSREVRIIETLREQERALIRRGMLPSIAFRFIGRKPR